MFLINVVCSNLGLVGHYLFRDYLLNQPDIKKMLVTSTLILITYAMQIMIFALLYSMGIVMVCPIFMANLLIKYPNESCFFYGILDFIGFIPMNLLLVVLFIIREIRNHFPVFYNSLAHEFYSKCLCITMAAICFVTFLVQVVSCHHVCRAIRMNNFYTKLSKYHNYTIDDFHLSENAKCWIPFGEVSALSTLVTVLLIMTSKFYKIIRSSSPRDALKKLRLSLRMKSDPIVPAPIAEYGNSISLIPIRDHLIMPSSGGLQSFNTQNNSISMDYNLSNQSLQTEPSNMIKPKEDKCEKKIITNFPSIEITPPVPEPITEDESPPAFGETKKSTNTNSITLVNLSEVTEPHNSDSYPTVGWNERLPKSTFSKTEPISNIIAMVEPNLDSYSRGPFTSLELSDDLHLNSNLSFPTNISFTGGESVSETSFINRESSVDDSSRPAMFYSEEPREIEMIPNSLEQLANNSDVEIVLNNRIKDLKDMIFHSSPEISCTLMTLLGLVSIFLKNDLKSGLGIFIEKSIVLLFCFSPWLFILHFGEIKNSLKRKYNRYFL